MTLRAGGESTANQPVSSPQPATSTTSPVQSDPIIDTTPEPSAPEPLATNEQLNDIVTWGQRVTNPETGQPFTVGEIAGLIKQNHGCDPDRLTSEKAAEMINRLRDAVEKKQPSAV